MSYISISNIAPKVSVIVPVYKTEKYLRRCLDSILCQTLNEIEIIVLNDGSPDGSWEIVKEYAKDDIRIMCLEHKNIGLGMTRNRGIEIASGEYLSFVDSDDYIEPGMMELMYQKAKEEGLDVVVCQAFINYEDSERIRSRLPDIEPIDLKTIGMKEFLGKWFFTNTYRYCSWDKIYKKSFIIENGICFGDNKKLYAEDLYFQFHLLLHQPLLNFLPETLCHYVQREESITSSLRRDYMKRHLFMVNGFYDSASGSSSWISVMTDIVLFRGLLNETKYSVQHNLGFKFLKKSFVEFYKNPAYRKFIDSAVKNKSSELIPNKYRKILFRLFIIFQRLRMRRISEYMLYLRFKAVYK